MELRKIKYDYSKIKDKTGTDYAKFMEEISEIKNMVYFLCKNSEYISVRYTQNSLKERLFTNTPKLFNEKDFAESDEIVALLLESNNNIEKLKAVKNTLAFYYGLSEKND